jgi:hypothetical protein
MRTFTAALVAALGMSMPGMARFLTPRHVPVRSGISGSPAHPPRATTAAALKRAARARRNVRARSSKR